MNFQNDRYTLRMAEAADDAGIREIFESGSFAGGIGVQFLRPSPLQSFAADGDAPRMMVIHDNEQHRTAAVGGAVVRTEYLHGVPAKCAYLTGLKIHPDYQKQIFFIARAYQFLRGQLADCACCYTTILDGNTPVIRMLEKKHRNMPEYRYLGHYTTYCFRDARRMLPLVQDAAGDLPAQHYDLTPVRQYPGMGEGHFWSYQENGRVRACCFAGDQTAFKQYKMAGYSGIYRLLSHLPTQLAGYPAFPKAGRILRHGCISGLYIEDNDPKLCRAFLRTVAAETGFELLLWGGFAAHPLCPALDAMKTVRYGSRLYEVVWDGEGVLSDQIGMEAALL